jgi:menaquinone-dependent protoporphyrinogen oxidase
MAFAAQPDVHASAMEAAMTRVLVFFGTTNGHTARIAGTVAEVLRERGLTVDLVDGAHASPSPDGYDAVVVAASVHAGGYQRRVRRWLAAHAAECAARPSAFVSVCLGVLQHEPKVDADLWRIRETLFVSTRWRPEMVKVVAGALPYTRYNWITRWVMRRIARKAGGDTDTSRDYEYTDWNDLRAFAGEFAAYVIRRRASGPAASQAHVA